MNIRERIADFISGRAITKLKEENINNLKMFIQTNAESSIRWIKLSKEATSQLNSLREEIRILSIDNKNGWLNSNRFKTALEEIANIKTPTSSTLAKHMAQIAKDALG